MAYETKPDVGLPEWAILEVINDWLRWGYYLPLDDHSLKELRRRMTARYDQERALVRQPATSPV